jgi:hypothetical protein
VQEPTVLNTHPKTLGPNQSLKNNVRDCTTSQTQKAHLEVPLGHGSVAQTHVHVVVWERLHAQGSSAGSSTCNCCQHTGVESLCSVESQWNKDAALQILCVWGVRLSRHMAGINLASSKI